ncbi:glycosyltransferase [Zafaria sp. J156]|uniref:glycosyltransferase n=1 Tax=Zafaria sp. J156 TaxID=3116490 RepID=UPI002E79CCD4|nr:glycosyltransferase [Zafaria sp. J156]MEE1620741.1 glycosyltransferase [Zafaria sp. J156]
MTSRDQSSTAAPLERALIHRVRQDPAAMADEIVRLRRLARDNAEQIHHLENEAASLQAAAGKAAEKLAKAVRRRERLELMLERQTERVAKYKTAYEQLRSVPHLKTAAAVLQPVVTTRRLWAKAARGRKPRPAVEPPGPALDPANGAAARTVPAATGASSESPAPAAGLTRAVLEAKQDFFVNGRIGVPAEELRRAWDGADTEEREALSERDAAFVGQLFGMERLASTPPEPGPRQPGPGYVPVRGRVMYCAHSTGRFNSNGYSTRTAGLVQALSETGSDVFVAARPGYPWDVKTSEQPPGRTRFEQEIDGVRHVFNPGPRWTRDPLDTYVLHAADAFVREAMVNRPAVIHAASNHVTALPALLAARRLGLPFIYEVRGLWEVTEAAGHAREWLESDRFDLAVRLETLVATSADRVLAITEEVRDELVRRGVDPARIRIVPNAADTSRFVPVPPDRKLAKKLGLVPGQFVVGYAGSLVAYEGLEVLLVAHRQLLEAVPDARLVIVGDGPAGEALKKRATELGINEHVTFTGRVPAEMIPRYLSLFDVAPCPRVSNMVTEMVSPLKPLEAMAAGRCVVASDVAPLRHLLGPDGVRGVLVPAGSSRALADALKHLAGDARHRADLGRAARAWAVEERSWPAIARAVRTEHRVVERDAHVEGGRALREVTVGLIADEFTTTALAPECRIVRIAPPGEWDRQLDEAPFDVLVVESAWSGNGGSWHRKVGYYGEQEFDELKRLVEACRRRGIPTIFWNKEDPVHVERFLPTAAEFDHVFTTDADCIPRYLAHPERRAATVAALPFFAQAELHRPFGSDRPFEPSVAYGGSFYGDRYPQRSRELARILDGVGGHGLTIYDRQVNHPDSPYRFPDRLAGFVRGGLDYAEMVKAYTSHPVHVNVNSVDASPTMFSRRVMELAACGTPVISGAGRGVATFFGEQVPQAGTADEASALAEYWLNDEAARNADGWALHRTVYRAHLASHRLALMLRTAGLVVAVPAVPAYVLELASLDEPAAVDVLRQTHRPLAVHVADRGEVTESARERLMRAGIPVHLGHDEAAPGDVPRAFLDRWAGDPVLAEDLARSYALAGTTAELQDHDLEECGHSLLETRAAVGGRPWFGLPPEVGARVVGVRRALPVVPEREASAVVEPEQPAEARTVLVAGHDLKFAGGIMDRLRASGHTVLIDHWADHDQHDAAASRELLASADVVFCEWSLGNAAWYARNKRPGQRLTVRFHSQELFTGLPGRTQLGRVDHTVFVGELIRSMAARKFGHDPARTSVVPNAVDARLFDAAKDPAARFVLGLVGIVPAQKHLDRALDVLAGLRAVDDRYVLRIKGKTPADYPWMAKRPEEMAYYDEQFRRLEEDPLLAGAVHFDAHGDDMAEWYRTVGTVLSVSDFESFHLTLADGAASGALPVSLAWAGAESIYPGHWLHLSTASMVERILAVCSEPDAWARATTEARDYAREHFHEDDVLARLEEVILGAPAGDGTGTP